MDEDTVLPGGVNTPVTRPDFYPDAIARGDGAVVETGEGEEYIDLHMAYGAQLFGHADPQIRARVEETMEDGWLFAEPHPLLHDIAARVVDLFPGAELAKFAVTGSDVVAYAVRCARSSTGCTDVLHVDGSYHGVHEGLVPSDGVPEAVADATMKVPFNDADAVRDELQTGDYAAVLLEPVLKDVGCVLPTEGYLQAVREACTETGTLLVFDEVLTGVRIGPGGIQSKFGVTPDLTTVSKALAGGLPLSVVCGREEYMTEFTPAGDVWLAGTFNANPVGLAAADAVVERITEEPVYEDLAAFGDEFRSFLRDEFARYSIDVCVQGIDSIVTIALGMEADEFTRGLHHCDFAHEYYPAMVQAGMEAGVLLPPSTMQSMYLSTAHLDHRPELRSAFSEIVSQISDKM